MAILIHRKFEGRVMKLYVVVLAISLFLNVVFLVVKILKVNTIEHPIMLLDAMLDHILNFLATYPLMFELAKMELLKKSKKTFGRLIGFTLVFRYFITIQIADLIVLSMNKPPKIGENFELVICSINLVLGIIIVPLVRSSWKY